MTGTRRGSRRRIQPKAELTITSMMDMFVILLLFLLVFFDPENQSTPDFELPTSAMVKAPDAGPKLRVTLAGVEINGKRVVELDQGRLPSAAAEGGPLPKLVEALASARESATAPTTGGPVVLMVECDKRVPWSSLGSVLESAADAGFPNYRFVVLGSE